MTEQQCAVSTREALDILEHLTTIYGVEECVTVLSAALDEREALVSAFSDANELHSEVREQRDALRVALENLLQALAERQDLGAEQFKLRERGELPTDWKATRVVAIGNVILAKEQARAALAPGG